jgi:hypothetical protein
MTEYDYSLVVSPESLQRELKQVYAAGNARLANLLGPAFDPFLAQQIELSHHPESDNCELMIKRVGEPYSRTLHDDEASWVDSGQFVQVGAPEIFPRPLQIA